MNTVELVAVIGATWIATLVIAALVYAITRYPRLHARLGGLFEFDAWRPSGSAQESSEDQTLGQP